MNILLTAGPTREPIDPVRYIGNRSSGRMGQAIASAALAARHQVTAIVGPAQINFEATRRIDIETAQQMHDAVMSELPRHDALIMAAAVGDFRPVQTAQSKLPRDAPLLLELEPTPDIVALAKRACRPDQRVIGFGLDLKGQLDRARQKMLAKALDMMVFNDLATMDSVSITATLLWPDGRTEPLGSMSKIAFADRLIAEVAALWPKSP
jgi:phosphopantothenoylcysteine decarboxylase / phosphopantothenate---cysteine ligase